MTMSDFGSPSSSPTTQNTSMPSLEQPTASFQEGSVRANGRQTSSMQESGQDEWSSVDEDDPPITASVAFRGEIYALNAAPSLSDTDNVPPKTIAQGMQDPDRKAALLREFDGHTGRRTFKIVDKPSGDVPIMQSFMLQSNKYDEHGNVKLCKARHVVDGRGQDKYPYDIDTYAPNLQKESFRFLCWVAAQFRLAMLGEDVVQAFTVRCNPQQQRSLLLLASKRFSSIVQGERHSFQAGPSLAASGCALRTEERFALLEY